MSSDNHITVQHSFIVYSFKSKKKVSKHIHFLKPQHLNMYTHAKHSPKSSNAAQIFPPHPLQYRAVSMETSSSFWHWKVETCRKYERPPGSSHENGWRARSVVMWGGGVLKSTGFTKVAVALEWDANGISFKSPLLDLLSQICHYAFVIGLLGFSALTAIKTDVVLSCKWDADFVAEAECLKCRSRAPESTRTSSYLICQRWNNTRWGWLQLPKQLKLLYTSHSEKKTKQNTSLMQQHSTAPRL